MYIPRLICVANIKMELKTTALKNIHLISWLKAVLTLTLS